MSAVDPVRHEQVKAIFGEVAGLDPDAAAAALDRLCAGDASLREEVESLLSHDAAPRVRLDAAAPAIRDAIAQVADEGLLRADGPHPSRLGDFVVLGVLGEGGMGLVYLAEQQHPRRIVALKVLRPGVGGRMALRRFRREAELLGRVRHPNIAQVYASGTADLETPAGVVQLPFFALEYVEGRPITEHCRERGLGVRERLRLMAAVCDAVEHAHAAGILHRDLKPANVLVDGRGEPRILDFGIARPVEVEAAATFQTEADQIVGTLPYMSPEQLSGRPGTIDRRSDVYALGVMLYELLSERLPLDLSGRGLADAVRRAAEEEPAPLGTIDRSLRGDVETIVATALEKDPRRRYQTAAALRDEIERHLADRPIEARPPSTLYQLGKFARRNRPLVAGVAIAFAAMAVATAGSIWFALDALRARDLAEERLEYAGIENRRSIESFALLQEIIQGANPAEGGRVDMTVLELLDRGVERLETRAADQPQVASMVLRLIGATYYRLGELEKSERMLRRAVELHRESDWDDQTLIRALLDLGNTLRDRARFAEAAAAFEEALQRSRARADGGMRPDELAGSLNDLGLLRMELGDYEAASDALSQSISMWEVAGLGRSRNAAIAMVNLGSTLIYAGRLAESETMLRRALEIQVELLGEAHQGTLQNRNNLAVNLRRQGRYDESLAMLRRVAELRATVLPPGHFEIASGLSNVGHTETVLGRPEVGEPILREALAGRIAALGEHHPDTARTRMALGATLAALGRDAEAQSLLEQALADAEAAYGPTHLHVADVHLELARLANQRGDAATAASRATAALEAVPIAIRGDAAVTAAAMAERGLAAWRRGDFPQAEAELRAALHWRLDHLDAEHPETADAVCMLAALRLAEGAARGLPVGDAGTDELPRRLEAAAAAYEARASGAPWRAAMARALASALVRDGAMPGLDLPPNLPWWAREALADAGIARSPAASR